MRNNREIVTEFVKASASQGMNTDCVEVARTADGGRAVRDSKRPAPVQFHSSVGWSAFLGGVKAGHFGG
jgi:hypothetical protein